MYQFNEGGKILWAHSWANFPLSIVCHLLISVNADVPNADGLWSVLPQPFHADDRFAFSARYSLVIGS